MFTFNTTTDQLNRDESIIKADYLVADYYKWSAISSGYTNWCYFVGYQSPRIFVMFFGVGRGKQYFQNITVKTHGGHLVNIISCLNH